MRLEDADTVAYTGRELAELLATSVERTVVISRRPRSQPSVVTFPPVVVSYPSDSVVVPAAKRSMMPWTITAWAMLVASLVGIGGVEIWQRRAAAARATQEARVVSDAKLPLAAPGLGKNER